MVNCIKCPLFALGYNSNIIGRLGDFIKFYGKIPDIFVLITGHFGLFKTSTLRLREAGKTQAQSQTWRLNISKTDFKSVRKTITLIQHHYPSRNIFPLGTHIPFQLQNHLYQFWTCKMLLYQIIITKT